jgi:hypothetical protein
LLPGIKYKHVWEQACRRLRWAYKLDKPEFDFQDLCVMRERRKNNSQNMDREDVCYHQWGYEKEGGDLKGERSVDEFIPGHFYLLPVAHPDGDIC